MLSSDQRSSLSDSLANASVPSDPSTASETEHIELESTGFSPIDRTIFNNLRSAITSQHIELQHFVEDWSKRQHRVIHAFQALTTWDTFEGQPHFSSKSLDSIPVTGNGDTKGSYEAVLPESEKTAPSGKSCGNFPGCLPEPPEQPELRFESLDDILLDGSHSTNGTHEDLLNSATRSSVRFSGAEVVYESGARRASVASDDSRSSQATVDEESYPQRRSSVASSLYGDQVASSAHSSANVGAKALRSSIQQMMALETEEEQVKSSSCYKSRGLNFFLPEKVEKRETSGYKEYASDNLLTKISFYDWCQFKYEDAAQMLKNPHDRSFLDGVVLSNKFGAMTAIVILMNSVFIGYTSDYATKNLLEPTTAFIDFMELSFTLFYTFELMLRMIALGWFFFFTPDWKWNLFDATLVLIGIVDQIIQLVFPDSSGNAAHMRVARLPKMFRLIRVFRIVRMLRKLRIILNSMVECMKAMVWSIVLIILVTYVSGVVILQGATAERERRHAVDESHPDIEELEKYWGSLLDSMVSLYASTTGGIDWHQVAESLEVLGLFYYLTFLLFITFFIFVLMNILTSLFVSTSIRSAEQDRETIIAEAVKRREEQIEKMKTMFSNIGHNNDKLWQPDFEIVLQDIEMIAFMSTLEIEPMDVEHFFNILSNDGKDGVDIHDFVSGCLKMGGQARSMDLLGLIHAFKDQTLRFKKMEKDLASINELLQTKHRQGGHAFDRMTAKGIVTASL